MFCVALLVAGVVFVVLAATADPDRRGALIGLAIVWFALAGGAVALVLALERRLRTGRPSASREPGRR